MHFWLKKSTPIDNASGLYFIEEDILLINGDTHGDNECQFTSLATILQNFGQMGDPDPEPWTPSITPTPVPPDNYTAIQGTVSVGDYVPVDTEVPVIVRVRLYCYGNPVLEQNIIMDNFTDNMTSGSFSFDGIPPGSYDVGFGACTWLQKIVPVEKETALYDMGTIELINGDLHGDNECYFTSLSIVLQNIGMMGDLFHRNDPPEEF